MIAVGKVLEYGLQGRKLREMKAFLVENIERRFMADENEYRKMKHFINRQVTDLNARYPKTVPLVFKADDPFTYGEGYFRFMRPNTSVAVLTLVVLVVSPYQEGGADAV